MGACESALADGRAPLELQVRPEVRGAEPRAEVLARIRGGAEVVSVEDSKGGILSVVRVTVEIEGEKRPGCIAETVSLYFPEK